LYGVVPQKKEGEKAPLNHLKHKSLLQLDAHDGSTMAFYLLKKDFTLSSRAKYENMQCAGFS
jgi:hypothetical protein